MIVAVAMTKPMDRRHRYVRLSAVIGRRAPYGRVTGVPAGFGSTIIQSSSSKREIVVHSCYSGPSALQNRTLRQ